MGLYGPIVLVVDFLISVWSKKDPKNIACERKKDRRIHFACLFS